MPAPSNLMGNCARSYTGPRSPGRDELQKRGFAGIDLGGTRIKVGLADEEGHLLSCNMFETRNCRNADSLLDTIAAEIGAQAIAAGIAIGAAGIGCPGRIDFTAGKVIWLQTKLEFLQGMPLAETLGARIGCPVACDNDVNAILAGEMRFGAGRNHRNVVAITVGTGVGGALVVDGHMVRGHSWASGHFGYMSLDTYGPRHVCGNTGIIEEHASHSGILEQLHTALAAGEVSPLTESLARGEEPGLRELFEVADNADPLARRLADRMIVELGVLVANLIYVLDPEIVLVGGGLITHRPDVLDAIRREVATRVAFLPSGATEILPMALGDTAGVLGGVALAIEAIHQPASGLRVPVREK